MNCFLAMFGDLLCHSHILGLMLLSLCCLFGFVWLITKSEERWSLGDTVAWQSVVLLVVGGSLWFFASAAMLKCVGMLK